jgi:hypothetical protein
MIITDVTYTVSKYPVQYMGQRIKKDEEGETCLTHGRPEVEDVYQTKMNVKLKFLYLVRNGNDSAWMREAEIVARYGKKAFKKAQKAILTPEKIAEVREAFIRQES